MGRIKKKVARWAILLDLFDPTWYERVNPHTIDLNDNSMCVIGQAFGNFHNSGWSQQFRRTYMTLSGIRNHLLTPRPFFYLKDANRYEAENAWANEIIARQEKPPFDDRARYLRRRIWVTPTPATDREQVTA